MEGPNDVASPSSTARALGDWFGWAIVDLAPDGILVVDEGGNVLVANGAACRQFGRGRSEMVGRRVEQLIPARYHAAHIGHRHDYEDAPMVRPMGAGEVLFGSHADGSEFPVDVSLSPFSSASGMRVVVIVRDASDREARRQEELIARDGAHIEMVRQGLNSVVQRLFKAGLMLASLESGCQESQARQVRDVVDELDLALRGLRQAIVSTPMGGPPAAPPA